MKKRINIQFLIIFLIKEVLLVNWIDYVNLFSLNLSNNQINSIQGIQILTKLSFLNLKDNHIVSIQAIENLKNLEFLILSKNQIITIEGIEKLNKLNSLVLSYNQISSIQGIENLTNLNELYLDNNQIVSIKGIEKLTNLNELSLNNNKLFSIQGLQKLTSLYYLELRNNQLDSIESIVNLTNLEFLYLSNNQIISIDGLYKLLNLNSLELNNNNIMNIQAIENLTNLKYLYLFNNRLNSIESIKKLTNLKYLFLSSNHINSIKGIGYLRELNTLELKNNQIVSINDIENLTNLNWVDMSNNKIASIKEIENLTNLKWLDTSNNQINSIKSLANLTKLTSLFLSNNKIVSIQEIENLTNLEYLYLSNNQIISIRGIEKLKKLSWLDFRYNNINDVKTCGTLDINAKILLLTFNVFQKIRNFLFQDLKSIESINLDYNQVQYVEPMAFYSLNNLTFLSLKNNFIRTIYNYYFNKLKKFDISGNNILLINENSFQNVSSLYIDYSSIVAFKNLNYSYFCSRFLHLGNQKIQRLYQNTLNGLYSSIDLSINLLTSNSFETHSFGYLPNLNEISFSKNLIVSLDFNNAFQFYMSNIKHLSFENNKISKIQKGFFSKFQNLNVLFLSNNNFGSLKNYYFYTLDRLEFLNLSNNQILTIEEKTFENLCSLVYLNLSDNLIYDFSQNIFNNLSKLEFLILSENKLESIEKNYFQGLNSLKFLDLANNQIKFLHHESFQAILNLEDLYLKSNLINFLNDSLLVLKYLSTFDISYNKLVSFKSEHVISNISNLDLSFNPLQQFEHNQSNLSGLKSLKLKNLNSSIISNTNFEFFSKLEKLDISENFNINTIDLKNLTTLKKLNLKNTNSSDCFFISSLKGIEEWDVGNNKNFFHCLRYIKNIYNIKSLKIANISLREKFSNIGLRTYMFNNLIYLEAGYNFIVSMDGIHDLIGLIYLDLKFNIIDNVIIDTNKHFNFNKLTKLQYINLNNSLAKSLSNFELKFGNNLEIAVLSSNDLKIFPKFCEQDDSEIIPNDEFSCNLRKLYLDFNNLEELKQNNFIFLEKMEFLNLHSNNISLIEDYCYYNLKSLETLILSNNKLNLTNNSDVLFSALTNIKLLNLSFNLIEFINLNTFSNLLKLEVLDLSNNKIHTIKEDSFRGLINLRDLYINRNEPDLKIENSSFNQFEEIKTIFIDRSILNNSFHKIIFIDMAKKKNYIHNKTIFRWSYFQALNLITLNEPVYECYLVFELIRFNIQYNLKTETHFSDYIENCQTSKLKSKYSCDINIQEDKPTINFLYLFLLMISFILFVALIWSLSNFFPLYKTIQFLLDFFKASLIFKSYFFGFFKKFIAKTKSLLFSIFRQIL